MQQLLFFEPVKGFRLTGGAFYGGPGFNPTAGMQYVNAGRVLFMLISPRINIESDPSFSIFTILRYKPDIARNTKLYLAAQLLNTFDTSDHIKSYQWLRVGLDLEGTQFGIGVNFDEFGPTRTSRRPRGCSCGGRSPEMLHRWVCRHHRKRQGHGGCREIRRWAWRRRGG